MISIRLALAAAMTLVVGEAAHAATYLSYATYTGVVTDGYDQSGQFGQAGRALDGRRVRIVFKLNASDTIALGVEKPGQYGEPGLSGIYGGRLGAVDPLVGVRPELPVPITATVWIDGRATVFGQQYGLHEQSDRNGAETIRHEALGAFFYSVVTAPGMPFTPRGELVRDTTLGPLPNKAEIRQAVSTRVYGVGTDFLDGADFAQDSGVIDLTGAEATGAFEQYVKLPTTLSFPNGTTIYSAPETVYRNYASFRFTSLTYSAAPPTGGVPEPSAWALMIAGFGLAGATLRRRRPEVA